MDIASVPGKEVNEAEIYTFVLELASEGFSLSVNHTTRTGRVYQPPHLQGNDPQTLGLGKVPEYDILEQLSRFFHLRTAQDIPEAH